MQCGAKCFVVEVEHNGERKRIPVKAKSAVNARKTIRLKYEETVQIISVSVEK